MCGVEGRRVIGIQLNSSISLDNSVPCCLPSMNSHPLISLRLLWNTFSISPSTSPSPCLFPGPLLPLLPLCATRFPNPRVSACAEPSPCCSQRNTGSSGGQVLEELDGDLVREIARIPEAVAYERLSHVVGLSKVCCRRFLQLGGVSRMVAAGLLGQPLTSPAACRTAAHISIFCKLHEARDQVGCLLGTSPSSTSPSLKLSIPLLRKSSMAGEEGSSRCFRAKHQEVPDVWPYVWQSGAE